jgi:hypothetical protein
LSVSAISQPTLLASADVLAVPVVSTFFTAQALEVTTDLHLFPRYCTHARSFLPVRDKGAQITFFATTSRSTRFVHFAVGTSIRFRANHAVLPTAFAVNSTADLSNHILDKILQNEEISL